MPEAVELDIEEMRLLKAAKLATGELETLEMGVFGMGVFAIGVFGIGAFGIGVFGIGAGGVTLEVGGTGGEIGLMATSSQHTKSFPPGQRGSTNRL